MNKKQTRIIVLGIALFFLFVGGVIFGNIDWITRSVSMEWAVSFPDDRRPDGLVVTADVVSVDHLAGELTIRLEFESSDDLLDENNVLAEDILLDIYGTTDKTEYLFPKGKLFSPKTVDLILIGQPKDYPFDAYYAPLTLSVSIPETEDGVTHYLGVPLAVDIFTDTPGYAVEVSEAAEEDAYDIGYADLLIEVQRSEPVFAFTLFLMAMQWILALVAFLVALVIFVQKRKVSIPNFGWLWALVFAQIALRNAMPGAPPVGALVDFLSFFWVLGIIVAAMLVLVIIWIFRGE